MVGKCEMCGEETDDSYEEYAGPYKPKIRHFRHVTDPDCIGALSDTVDELRETVAAVRAAVLRFDSNYREGKVREDGRGFDPGYLDLLDAIGYELDRGKLVEKST